jgi:hypothetical protein
MSTPQQPSDASDPVSSVNTPPTAPAADEDEVHGYYHLYCSACSHMHYQSDPKCVLQCAHGSSYRVPGANLGIGGAPNTPY